VPTIYDNIEQDLLPAIQDSIRTSYRGDFCVGYFRLSGWSRIASFVEEWEGGPEKQCRLLVGMSMGYDSGVREIYEELEADPDSMDAKKRKLLQRACAKEFQRQLTQAIPSNRLEADLRNLVRQIRAKKLVVQLSVRTKLHAKLYLFASNETNAPRKGYLGSSNLTQSGVTGQGELNIDVLDQDACTKLQAWFNGRWDDPWCLDISEELCRVIDESWAREEPLAPYLVYAKMLYHLSEEARQGLLDFRVPDELRKQLFDFQEDAVKIAAKILSQRGGVMLGDVVGLGKTRMATVLARLFEDDFGTLILSPANLVSMWETYRVNFGLRGEVLSTAQIEKELPDFRPYKLVIVDESHNFRGREGKRYKALRDYIERCGAQVILLSATPYNMAFTDLGSQLQLFLRDDEPLGIMPEKKIREVGGVALFEGKFQCGARTIRAFEKSEYSEDWVQFMRRYLVRRTRKYIIRNHTETDPTSGAPYLTTFDGKRAYFPTRLAKNLTFEMDAEARLDQYALLYSPDVVDRINALALPRYGLGGYLDEEKRAVATGATKELLDDIARGRQRLRGFCRTNLFKRLESSGPAFLESVERHILRDFVFLHALEEGLPIPIGIQDAASYDPVQTDEEGLRVGDVSDQIRSEEEYRRRATAIYEEERTDRSFRWLEPQYVSPTLRGDLLSDARAMLELLTTCGCWKPEEDRKVAALVQLLEETHSGEKVLVFTQFADTAEYLRHELERRGVTAFDIATGNSNDPTTLARRFSPKSNDARVAPDDELRILITTDVLSEGQNLQDGHVIVNFDLPWAIVRLIQRAGRVDRIGQESKVVYCYSFLPEPGVEEIIKLRERLRRRLKENGEVIGSDEEFFGDETEDEKLHALYSGDAGVLDDTNDADDENVDLVSYALEQWNRMTREDPSLEGRVAALQNVVYAAKESVTPGALLFVRTEYGNDVLTQLDANGTEVTSNPVSVLKVAACAPDTTGLPRPEHHHDTIRMAFERVRSAEADESQVSSLGAPTTVRRRVFTRLRPLLSAPILGIDVDAFSRAMESLHRHPLLSSAAHTISQALRTRASDQELAALVVSLSSDERLVLPRSTAESRKTEIICSMALLPPARHA